MATPPDRTDRTDPRDPLNQNGQGELMRELAANPNREVPAHHEVAHLRPDAAQGDAKGKPAPGTVPEVKDPKAPERERHAVDRDGDGPASFKEDSRETDKGAQADRAPKK